MYHTLTILLHRPFVSDGHLRCTSPSLATTSFNNCAIAALEITQILRAYEDAFSIKSAPYIISYATYVCATIHVRIAAQRPHGSDAHKSLSTCLRILEVHEKLYLGPKRALGVVRNLIELMSVGLESSTQPAQADAMTSQTPTEARSWDVSSARAGKASTALMPEQEYSPDWEGLNELGPISDCASIDMDAVIQSFDINQMMDFQPSDPDSRTNFPGSPTSPTFAQETWWPFSGLDPLFGLDNFFGHSESHPSA